MDGGAIMFVTQTSLEDYVHNHYAAGCSCEGALPTMRPYVHRVKFATGGAAGTICDSTESMRVTNMDFVWYRIYALDDVTGGAANIAVMTKRGGDMSGNDYNVIPLSVTAMPDSYPDRLDRNGELTVQAKLLSAQTNPFSIYFVGVAVNG